MKHIEDFKGTPGQWRTGIADPSTIYGGEIGKSRSVAETTASDPYEAEANARIMAQAKNMAEVLIEAHLQIHYLHEKFQETGSGNNVLSRIENVIDKAL